MDGPLPSQQVILLRPLLLRIRQAEITPSTLISASYHDDPFFPSAPFRRDPPLYRRCRPLPPPLIAVTAHERQQDQEEDARPEDHPR